MQLLNLTFPGVIARSPEMLNDRAINPRRKMNFIEAVEEGLIIPYKTAIALYHGGFIDGAVLAHCLPLLIAEQHCPEVHLDTDKIQQVQDLLQNLEEE